LPLPSFFPAFFPPVFLEPSTDPSLICDSPIITWFFLNSIFLSFFVFLCIFFQICEGFLIVFWKAAKMKSMYYLKLTIGHKNTTTTTTTTNEPQNSKRCNHKEKIRKSNLHRSKTNLNQTLLKKSIHKPKSVKRHNSLQIKPCSANPSGCNTTHVFFSIPYFCPFFVCAFFSNVWRFPDCFLKSCKNEINVLFKINNRT